MFNLKNFKGFTLVEVILVILIIGILAGIVIPRISYSSNQAKIEACNANVSLVNAMIEYAYVKDNVAYPTTDAELATFLGTTTYFPDGAPTCPFTTAYTVTATNRCAKHAH